MLCTGASQVRSVLESVDPRRSGVLSQAQVSTALQHMGLHVSPQETVSFLESVGYHGSSSSSSSSTYSVEALSQAISDIASGQDRRHAKADKMAELLAAPPPAATQSAMALGEDALNGGFHPRRVDLEDHRTRKDKLVWSKMMARVAEDKDQIVAQLRAAAAANAGGGLSVSP
jgi:hypothetical protein